ncbi:hypothetical protein SELMODRAFT_429850 [Selaginella moellendorffii]|uniref:F-box domain-containing protein n=1 Tax=Selaginella moellendorffii TaxID=88036 RepID=D8T7I6_SELML|nr:hypothetical protein SELMODRAFT_429850 [Selaginella moellendorffii]
MGNKRYLGLELKRSLISGLPNDVARHCLAKVPRIYHRSMRSVSRTWKKTLESEDFFAVRRKSGIADAWLVVILMENGHNSYCIYNLASKSLLLKAPLPDPPLPTGLEIGDVGGGGFATFKTAAVGALLVVLESRTSSRRSSVENHTRIFDSIKNKWRAGSPPTVARSQFAMATVNGTVYVAGGCDHDGDFVPATESYDVATDTWTQRSTMPYNNLDRVDCKVVFQVLGDRCGWVEGKVWRSPASRGAVIEQAGEISINTAVSRGFVSLLKCAADQDDGQWSFASWDAVIQADAGGKPSRDAREGFGLPFAHSGDPVILAENVRTSCHRRVFMEHPRAPWRSLLFESVLPGHKKIPLSAATGCRLEALLVASPPKSGAGHGEPRAYAALGTTILPCASPPDRCRLLCKLLPACPGYRLPARPAALFTFFQLQQHNEPTCLITCALAEHHHLVSVPESIRPPHVNAEPLLVASHLQLDLTIRISQLGRVVAAVAKGENGELKSESGARVANGHPQPPSVVRPVQALGQDGISVKATHHARARGHGNEAPRQQPVCHNAYQLLVWVPDQHRWP